VINGRLAVKENGLLDATQSQQLGVKIVVFLGAADSQRDMVMTLDGMYSSVSL
jgi:hypothetical protein